MSLPIHIPEPCHENWDGMTAQSNGRFCGSCEKIVVDFSTWEPEEILDYIQSNTKTCGRFKASQLATPKTSAKDFSWVYKVFQSALAPMSKVAAVVVLLFHLASCSDSNHATERDLTKKSASDTNVTVIVTGEIIAQNPDSLNDHIVGEFIPPPEAPPPPPKIVVPEPVRPESYIMGGIPSPRDKPEIPTTESDEESVVYPTIPDSLFKSN